MVEGLKSISRRIHWSLLLKAAAFGVAWWWLPYWLFFFAALFLYFIPISRTGRLIAPFSVLLVLTYAQGSSAFFALIFGILFYVILIIKDLLVIDRRSTNEFLTLLLAFLLLRDFYLQFNQGVNGAALMYSFLLVVGITFLLGYSVGSLREEGVEIAGSRLAALWLSFLLLWQAAIAGLFLPVDFTYQTTIIFLFAVLIIDLVPQQLAGILSRQKILTTATAVLTLLVIVFVSARWGL